MSSIWVTKSLIPVTGHIAVFGRVPNLFMSECVALLLQAEHRKQDLPGQECSPGEPTGRTRVVFGVVDELSDEVRAVQDQLSGSECIGVFRGWRAAREAIRIERDYASFASQPSDHCVTESPST